MSKHHSNSCDDDCNDLCLSQDLCFDEDDCDDCPERKDSSYCDCIDCKGKECRVKWPPCVRDKCGTDSKLTHIFVPGDFCSLDDALRCLSTKKTGYVIHLRPRGIYTLSKDFTMDIHTLRIQGDCDPVKGVGYIHKLGQWDKAKLFDEQFNGCKGGVAPWKLKICTAFECAGSIISVNGCKNPDFSKLCNKDKIMFHHKDGTLSKHTVKCGFRNKIFLWDEVQLEENEKGHPEIRQGEGFFVLPSVIIKTKCRQKLTVQKRMEYQGISFKTEPLFVTGATAGSSEVENCVIFKNYVNVGTMDWYKPNVIVGKFSMMEGYGGVAFFQTALGKKANIAFSSNPFTNWSYAIFAGCEEGLTLKNGASVATTFTDYCDCTRGSQAFVKSSYTIGGSRYFKCECAISLFFGASFSSQTFYGLDDDCYAIQFTDCTVMFDMVFSE